MRVNISYQNAHCIEAGDVKKMKLAKERVTSPVVMRKRLEIQGQDKENLSAKKRCDNELLTTKITFESYMEEAKENVQREVTLRNITSQVNNTTKVRLPQKQFASPKFKHLTKTGIDWLEFSPNDHN